MLKQQAELADAALQEILKDRKDIIEGFKGDKEVLQRKISRLQSHIRLTHSTINFIGEQSFDEYGVSQAPESLDGGFSITRKLDNASMAWLNLEDIFRGVVDEVFSSSKQELNISFEIIGLEVLTSADIFRYCILELLQNAVKYSDRTGSIQVKVNRDSSNEALELLFRNRGPYLSKKEREIIPTYGYRSVSALASGAEGTGAGLVTARDTLRTLGLDLRYTAFEQLPNQKGLSYHNVLVIVPKTNWRIRRNANETVRG